MRSRFTRATEKISIRVYVIHIKPSLRRTEGANVHGVAKISNFQGEVFPDDTFLVSTFLGRYYCSSMPKVLGIKPIGINVNKYSRSRVTLCCF